MPVQPHARSVWPPPRQPGTTELPLPALRAEHEHAAGSGAAPQRPQDAPLQYCSVRTAEADGCVSCRSHERIQVTCDTTDEGIASTDGDGERDAHE